jgi:hypothetical protein
VRILFDQGTPLPLRELLQEHEVSTAYERGWSKLTNGELLDAAEREGYALQVTTDSNLQFQQDLGMRALAIVVLMSTSWPRIKQASGAVLAAIEAASPGSYSEVPMP